MLTSENKDVYLLGTRTDERFPIVFSCGVKWITYSEWYALGFEWA